VTTPGFRAALLVGLVVHLAALWLPGTHDVGVWKAWAYAASTQGPTQVYGVGGSPTERRLIDFDGEQVTVDYPPLMLYELAVVGRAYRAIYGRGFPNTAALTATIKAAIVLAEIGLAALIFAAVRRTAGVDVARWATLAYWLNPACLLGGSVLGYLEPLFVLPATGALVAAVAGWPLLAGALAATAVLTKAQAVFLLPAVGLAVWNAGARHGRVRRLASAVSGGATATFVIVVPIVAAGAWPNMVLALSRLATHDMLSANACNLWWLVGYVVRAMASMHDLGAWTAWTRPTGILGISRFMEIGYPNPRIIGAILTLLAMGWAIWTARRARDLWLIAALGALLVQSYAVLSAQVHENHLFAAVPLLAIAAAGRRAFVPVLVAVSTIFALNLNIFYGISEDVGYAVPRDVTLVDLSVVLAVANCAALAWHAVVFSRECSRADARPRTSGPASIPVPAGHSRLSRS
jgi:hypothetical protein